MTMRKIEAKKDLIQLRVGSIALDIDRRQIPGLFDEDFERRLPVVVVQTELDLAAHGHRSVAVLTRCGVNAGHRIAASLQ